MAQIYFTATAFLPLLAQLTEQHKDYSGTVINIASVSGLLKDSQHHPAYNASKAAAIYLSGTLANLVAQNHFKIRINSISSSVFPSEITTRGSGQGQKSHIPKKYDKVPARRAGNEEDIARAMIHLVVNQYINGHNEVVDGGYKHRFPSIESIPSCFRSQDKRSLSPPLATLVDHRTITDSKTEYLSEVSRTY